MADDFQIVSPPSEIFKKAGFQTEPSKQVVVQMNTYIFHHMEFPESGGMFGWFVGCPFPAKGLPFPQAIYACNGAKRFFKQGMDIIASKEMLLPRIGFLLSFKKIALLEKVIAGYTNAAKMIVEPYFIEPKRMSTCAFEIRVFIETFLREIGITLEIARDFAEVFSHHIQYDDAYRLRIEDLMSMSSKEKIMKNPAREIKTLIAILAEREPHGKEATLTQIIESGGNVSKFAKIGTLLRILFFVPKIKKAFRKALAQSHFENFQLDDADRYHLMLRDDYDAMGHSSKERQEFYKAWHSIFMPMPPRIPVKLKE